MNPANPDWPVLIRRLGNVGYTQKRLADVCGVHENTISNGSQCAMWIDSYDKKGDELGGRCGATLSSQILSDA